MTLEQSLKAKNSRQKFMEWYQKEFGKKLPIYLSNETKKDLVRFFEQKTGIKYEN